MRIVGSYMVSLISLAFHIHQVAHEHSDLSRRLMALDKEFAKNFAFRVNGWMNPYDFQKLCVRYLVNFNDAKVIKTIKAFGVLDYYIREELVKYAFSKDSHLQMVRAPAIPIVFSSIFAFFLQRFLPV